MSILSIEEIKSTLPDVKVDIEGNISTGQIKGTKLSFPWIIVDNLTHFQVSWGTIQNSLNSGKPIIY